MGTCLDLPKNVLLLCLTETTNSSPQKRKRNTGMRWFPGRITWLNCIQFTLWVSWVKYGTSDEAKKFGEREKASESRRATRLFWLIGCALSRVFWWTRSLVEPKRCNFLVPAFQSGKGKLNVPWLNESNMERGGASKSVLIPWCFPPLELRKADLVPD